MSLLDLEGQWQDWRRQELWGGESAPLEKPPFRVDPMKFGTRFVFCVGDTVPKEGKICCDHK